MKTTSSLAPWIRRFLLEHLVGERNLSQNTQKSYRDTLLLFLPFVAQTAGKSVDRLHIEDVSSDTLRRFLLELEQKRGCSVSTRNQRLAAVHALARFIGEHSPEHIDWLAQIRSIPFKKTSQPSLSYLEKDEIDALLGVPDRRTQRGAREHALLLFLYNSGARVSEAAHLTIADLELGSPPSVTLLGKGGKSRRCPLWPQTAHMLASIVAGREPREPVFTNRRRQPITRFGIRALVKRSAQVAGRKMPSLSAKGVSTHTIRHTTAVHLLRSGVDINTIRSWLGHVCLDTTHIYAEVDLEMKAKALARCEIPGPSQSPVGCWTDDPKLMAFLKSL
jgi:integrase/recombinase XerD